MHVCGKNMISRNKIPRSIWKNLPSIEKKIVRKISQDMTNGLV